MLSFLAQGSPMTAGFLIVCLALVLAFEFSNGFHDTANAVATVIHTNSLKPLYAVVWSGLMNFLGVLLGGIAVAYALVQLIPPEVLSPPNGGTAVGMLVALFVSAKSVQYAPWWVRILSTLCLGFGTMVGYRRIVTTLGERLGKQKLVPAQGGSAELAAAAVIGVAGFTGFPVSTTHVVTGGISGTMVGSGAGLQPVTAWQIATAWVLTLPATIMLSGGLFYLLS